MGSPTPAPPRTTLCITTTKKITTSLKIDMIIAYIIGLMEIFWEFGKYYISSNACFMLWIG
jgi:hypothetical protein